MVFPLPPPGQWWFIGQNRRKKARDTNGYVESSSTSLAVIPFQPTRTGVRAYIGLPPPSPEDAAKIPYLSSIPITRAAKPVKRIPEFSYPDLHIEPPQVNFNLDLDPRLYPTPFRSYGPGNGAHMTLGGLQHLGMGDPSRSILNLRDPPGFYPSPTPHQQEDHHSMLEDSSKDAEGEVDDKWNSNIVYSFGADGEIIFPGEGHNADNFARALQAGLGANGMTAVWRSSHRRIEGGNL